MEMEMKDLKVKTITAKSLVVGSVATGAEDERIMRTVRSGVELFAVNLASAATGGLAAPIYYAFKSGLSIGEAELSGEWDKMGPGSKALMWAGVGLSLAGLGLAAARGSDRAQERDGVRCREAVPRCRGEVGAERQQLARLARGVVTGTREHRVEQREHRTRGGLAGIGDRAQRLRPPRASDEAHLEQPAQGVPLRVGGWPGQAQSESMGQAFVQVRTGRLRDRPRCQRQGRLHVDRVVEERQGLQGCVGTRAPDDAGQAGGCIEVHEAGVGGATFPNHVDAPAAPVFTFAHGAGNGVMTIATGTLPLALFGAGGFGLRQGLLMMPARFLQAFAPFLFDLLLSRVGLGALAVTAGFGIASFAVLSILRKIAR